MSVAVSEGGRRMAVREKRSGEYSAMPKGLRLADGQEFLRALLGRPILYEEFRQPMENGKYLGDMRLIYLGENEGYAIHREGQQIRLWQFGCAHEYRPMNLEECRRRGVSVYRRDSATLCLKCGDVKVWSSL